MPSSQAREWDVFQDDAEEKFTFSNLAAYLPKCTYRMKLSPRSKSHSHLEELQVHLLIAHDETGLYISVCVQKISLFTDTELSQMWGSKNVLLKTGKTSLFSSPPRAR